MVSFFAICKYKKIAKPYNGFNVSLTKV